MRILSIHIKNINSLKGTFKIDFASGALLHAGIFAITGPTGAGKTTVLDAITLALYGRVARNKDVKEVISNGTADCHAEVEFQVFDQKYLASWQIHRARGKVDGKLSAPKRELALWNEKEEAYYAVAEKIKEVDSAIEKVSGLDYHRFTRSVLLSQGDFAAFLRADERERSDLLERITGTEIYSELSIAAFERHKKEKQDLDALQSQLEQLGLFSEQIIDKKELAKAQKETKKAEKQVELVREKLQSFDRWKEAVEKTKTLEAEQLLALNEVNTFQPKALQLKQSKSLHPHSSSIEKIISWKEQIKTLVSMASELDQQYNNCIVDEKKNSAFLEEAIEAKAKFQKEKSDKEAVFHQVDKMNDQLDVAKLQYADHQSQEIKLDTLVKQKNTVKTTLAEGLNQLQLDLEQSEKWLANHDNFSDLHTTLPAIEELRLQLIEVYQDKEKSLKKQSVFEAESLVKQEEIKNTENDLLTAQKALGVLESEYEEKLPSDFQETEGNITTRLNVAIHDMQIRVQKIKQLSVLEEDYKNLLIEQQQYEDRLGDLMMKQQNTSKELLSLLDQKEDFNEELVFKRGVFNQQQLIVNYKKDRENLKEGDPCPLCLATHHPFHDHPVESFIDKARLELEKAEAFALRLEQDKGALFLKDNELHQEIESLLGDEIQHKRGHLEKQRIKLRAHESRMSELLHDPSEELEGSGAILLLKLTQFEKQLEDWKSVQIQLESLAQQMLEPKEKIQIFERKLLTIKGEFQTIKSQITTENDTIKKQEKRFEKLGGQLSKKTKKYNYQFSLETAKEAFQKLRLLATAFQEKQDQIEKNERQILLDKKDLSSFEKEIKQLEAELKSAQENKNTVEQKVQELTLKIQELLGSQPVEEARRILELKEVQLTESLEEKRIQHQKTSKQLVMIEQSLKEKKEQLAILETDCEKLNTSLLKSLHSLGYTSIELAIQDCLSATEESALEQTMLENNNRLIEIERAVKETQKELIKWTPSDKEKDKEEVLRSEYEELNTAYQASLYKYGQLEEKFQQQQKREQQHSQLLEQIEQQRNSFNRWAQLNDLIGQADGKKFRTYAQGLTLQKLVAIANQYLEKLNGRYFIHKKTDADLELEIIDTYQADNRRSMYTLSGGESFLISLALAMGLSELAGKNAQIQSLFIDEGFGTLDAQSLDLALSTLENLQSEGKTIGIISHLKELKERISVQIQLHKQSNGFSQLSVEG